MSVERRPAIVPLGLLYPVLVLAPLVMLRVRLLPGWPSRSPSAWVAVLVAALSATDIVLTVFIERHYLRPPVADRLRATGRDPEEAVALSGSVILLAPICWALGGSFMGLPLTQLIFYAFVSTAGVAYWGWRYRRVIYPR